MRFDPLTRTAVPSPLPASPTSENRKASPDGRWIAFTRGAAGSQQIWLTNVATGETEKLAGGSCNNSSPTWELDSSAVIFASDCGRAFGLPALYRASNAMVARKQRSALSDQLSARFRKLRKSHDRN